MIDDGTLLWQTFPTMIKTIVAAIGKWHNNLIFSEEGYSIVTKHLPHVKHK
jgi:hypothetical protein